MCEWRNVTIGEIIYNIGGTPLEKYVSDKENYKFISIGNYSVDGKYIDNGNRIGLNEKTKEKKLNKDDLVMILNDKTTTGDLIGSTILIDADEEYIYNQRSERIICKECVNPQFLWYVLNSKYFRNKVFKIAQGGTQIYINFKDIKQIKIKIPTIEQQNYICNKLSIIQNIIEIEKQQISLVEKFKQQLISKIFDKNIMGINAVGKIRDVVSFSGGSQPEKKFFLKESKEDYIRLIQIRDFKSDEYLTYIPEKMARKTCKKDDVMIGRYGPPVFQILRGLEGAYNVALIKCIPEKNYSKDYIYYMLLEEKLHRKIEWLSQRSSGQTGVDMEFLNNYPTIIPNQQQQAAIVNMLKLIDKKIEILTQQYKNYIEIKAELIEKLIVSNIR